eukprot:3149617-Rhodomonas_salina.3
MVGLQRRLKDAALFCDLNRPPGRTGALKASDGVGQNERLEQMKQLMKTGRPMAALCMAANFVLDKPDGAGSPFLV